MLEEFSLTTDSRVAFANITARVQRIVSQAQVQEGICHVYVPHTTAGATINEGADPDVVRDMIKALDKIVPFEDDYLHAEGNSAAHVKASMMGSHVSLLVSAGRILLGTWQAIFFCEFDGPRTRRVVVRVAP